MLSHLLSGYSWLGCKWTISLSILTYVPFMAAQFYPKFYTMIPAGLLLGIGAAPLWCAKCTYLTVVAEAYATLSDMTTDILVTRFFGLFFMFYQMAQVWGNLISSAGAYIRVIFLWRGHHSWVCVFLTKFLVTKDHQTWAINFFICLYKMTVITCFLCGNARWLKRKKEV